MYTLTGYGQMIADRVRREAYLAALEAAIAPGCTVLEIGTGPAVFALLAARLGAGRVVAVEPDAAIEVGRQLARANSLEDRVELVRGTSTRLELPRRADVVVSDLRGVLPFFGSHLASIIDARERLLAPGGVLIPRRDTLWVAPVSAPKLYRHQTCGWSETGLGLDLSLARDMVTHAWSRVEVSAEECLSEPLQWAELDYRTVTEENGRGRVAGRITRDADVHGLVLWFDTELGAGAGFSNAPGPSQLIYGRAFLPFRQPIAARAGDTVEIDLSASRLGDDYVWRWSGSIAAAGAVRGSFDQSSFFATPLAAEQLRRRAAGHVPELGEDGQVTRWVLERMDGKTSSETLARGLAEAFPGRYRDWRDALTRVGELAQRYSRRS